MPCLLFIVKRQTIQILHDIFTKQWKMIYDPPLEILCKRDENTYTVRFLIVNWVRTWSYLLMLKYAIKAKNIIIIIIILLIILLLTKPITLQDHCISLKNVVLIFYRLRRTELLHKTSYYILQWHQPLGLMGTSKICQHNLLCRTGQIPDRSQASIPFLLG